jgi:conjugal transfer mating pair stabilization protein TraG
MSPRNRPPAPSQSSASCGTSSAAASAFESATGTSNSDSIQTAFSEVDQASTNLQRQFGLSRRAADDISTAWFLGGEAGAKAGVYKRRRFCKRRIERAEGLEPGPTATSASHPKTVRGSSVACPDVGQPQLVEHPRRVRSLSVSTSSSSSISSTASGMNASLTEAQSYSREARRAEELANRLESQASFFEGNSAAGSLNLSQAYREWGLAEIERNRDFYGNVRFDDVSFQLSPEGQALQASSSKLRRTASRRD